MSWLRRGERDSPQTDRDPDEGVVAPVQAAAPGIAALLEGVSEDGSHSVLDLGAATASSLGVYRRFARRIRFADVAGHAAALPGRDAVPALLKAVPPQPEHPYDLVFAWDVLDRIHTEYHAPLVALLAELTTPDARLHVVARGSAHRTTEAIRFTLLDVDRMAYEVIGPAPSAPPRHLPAQLAHLLEPFRVLRGFTLKGDLREYVARRESG